MTLTVTIQKPLSDDTKSHSVELPASLFDVDTNVALIHQVVVAQLAAARQGTHATKTRGEVRGGGKKPYRQKGTGRARQGSTRAPQFAGGGTVHGPQPRDYSQRTPKKMKAAALRQALSDRARHGRVHVVDSLVEGDLPSTRDAAAALASITEAKNVLVVAGRADELSWKSLRNVDAVHVLEPGQLNTYDVLISDDVVFTQQALEEFVETRGDGATLTLTEVTLDKPKKAAAKKAAAKPAKAEKPAKADKASAKALVEVPDDAVATDDTDTDGPDYGPDSRLATEDGEQPKGFPIKGNADSMLYHVPDSRFYDQTIAEVWFKTAEAAEAAGFLLPPSQRDDAEADEADADEKDA
jgi:large subunit ribosomal protein L4